MNPGGGKANLNRRAGQIREACGGISFARLSARGNSRVLRASNAPRFPGMQKRTE